MQVFMPYDSYIKSVQALDDKRLRKQALEATQLLDIILDLPKKNGEPRQGWGNHPALLAWKDTPGALLRYLACCIREIKSRGFKTDYCEERFEKYQSMISDFHDPVWFGDQEIHSSHRYRLLQKGFEEIFKYGDSRKTTLKWYLDQGWKEINDPEFFDQECIWPTNINNRPNMIAKYELEQKASKETIETKKQMIEKFGHSAQEWIQTQL